MSNGQQTNGQARALDAMTKLVVTAIVALIASVIALMIKVSRIDSTYVTEADLMKSHKACTTYMDAHFVNGELVRTSLTRIEAKVDNNAALLNKLSERVSRMEE